MRTLIYIVLLALLPFNLAAELEFPDGIIEIKTEPATNFTITDMDGKQYSLNQSHGKWVFLHFWASWCGPCRKEMPTIQALKKKMEGKPIDIILINTAEDEDTIFSFLGAVAPSLQTYMDRQGELTELWAPRGLPTTFFIDPKGNRRFMALGGRPWDRTDYQGFITDLLLGKAN